MQVPAIHIWAMCRFLQLPAAGPHKCLLLDRYLWSRDHCICRGSHVMATAWASRSLVTYGFHAAVDVLVCNVQLHSRSPYMLLVMWPVGCQTEMRCCAVLQVPNLVGVPTHFFKVVLAESKSRNKLGAKPVNGAECPDAA